jgi:hypothetical protein
VIPQPPRHASPATGAVRTLLVARLATGLIVLGAVMVIAPTLLRRDAARAPWTGETIKTVGTTRPWVSLLHQHRLRVGVDVAPELAARLREGGGAVVTPLNARRARLNARVVGVADHVDVATQRVAVEVELDDTSSVIVRGAPVEVEVELP